MNKERTKRGQQRTLRLLPMIGTYCHDIPARKRQLDHQSYPRSTHPHPTLPLPVPSVVGSGSVLILFPLPSPSPTERALRGEWSGDGKVRRGTRGVRRALSHLTPFGSFIRARRSLALPSSVPSAGNRAHLGSLATLATPSAPLREVRKERAKRGVERRT